jgi:hypothetical protein
MQEPTDFHDLPHVIIVERRRQPDRRSCWRGGRRNTDWTNRPSGAWHQFEAQLVPWRQWLTKFSVRAESLRQQ